MTPRRTSRILRPLARRVQRGVALLEVLVSILIFSLGVLGLIAIQGNSVRAASESKFRADAMFAAQEILGTMWLDRNNLADYVGTTTLAGLPSGQRVITVAGRVVTVTITWRLPGDSVDRQFVTYATIKTN